MKKVYCLFILTICWVSFSFAQSPWLSDTRLSSVSLEWDKPIFNDRTFDRDIVTGATSVLFITGRARINDNLRIVAELPVSHFGYDGSNPAGGDDNSTTIGNVYVGGILDVNLRNPSTHSFIELGARIPTAPSLRNDKKFGNNTGRFSELDRQEAFGEDTWSIPLILNYVTSVREPFAVKFRLGTVYDTFVDDLKDNDDQLHLLYGLTTMYRKPNVEAHLGFSGRNQYVGLPSGVDFWDTGLTQLRAGVAWPFQHITPGIYARLPLGDNFTRDIDFAYGLSLEIRG